MIRKEIILQGVVCYGKIEKDVATIKLAVVTAMAKENNTKWSYSVPPFLQVSISNVKKLASETRAMLVVTGNVVQLRVRPDSNNVYKADFASIVEASRLQTLNDFAHAL